MLTFLTSERRSGLYLIISKVASPNLLTILVAVIGPTPEISPLLRYLIIPSHRKLIFKSELNIKIGKEIERSILAEQDLEKAISREQERAELAEVNLQSQLNSEIDRSKIEETSLLNKIITDCYHTYVPASKYPIVVLNIEVDPLLIDINIHPTKMDIKFSKMDSLKELVISLLEKSLKELTLIPNASVRDESSVSEVKTQIKKSEKTS